MVRSSSYQNARAQARGIRAAKAFQAARLEAAKAKNRMLMRRTREAVASGNWKLYGELLEQLPTESLDKIAAGKVVLVDDLKDDLKEAGL